MEAQAGNERPSLTGYAISTSEGRGVNVFGWFELPAWLPRSEMLRELATTTHEWLAYITAAVIVIHAAAALKHHFVDRDDTLKRML